MSAPEKASDRSVSMSEIEQEAGLTDSVLTAYMKEVGTHDLMSRDDEIRSFRELNRRAKECVTVLGSAPRALVEEWSPEADPGDDEAMAEAPEESEAPARPSDAVARVKAMWRTFSPTAKFTRAVLKDGESREWAFATVHSILTADELPDGCAAWASRLRREYARYSEVRGKIVSANLRFVIHMTRQFHRNGRHLHRLDLIQEGNIGLMKAVERFEVDRGYRFSTYAMWWIRHHMQRSLAERERTVRLPVHMVESLNKVGGIIQRRILQGLPVDDESLAKETGLPREKLRRMAEARTVTMSLDVKVGDAGDATYAEVLEDKAIRPPLAEMEHAELKRALERAMRGLQEVERKVIHMRFNLGGDADDYLTLAEIGTKFKLSRERIRQLEARALRKLQGARSLREHWRPS